MNRDKVSYYDQRLFGWLSPQNNIFMHYVLSSPRSTVYEHLNLAVFDTITFGLKYTWRMDPAAITIGYCN